jgi:hypothetical protein
VRELEKKNPPFAETIDSEAMGISQGEGQMHGQTGVRSKKKYRRTCPDA